jgi:hypothetical protein
MWTYHQSTGKLMRNGRLVGVGYSGHGEGRNNPSLEFVKMTGPIPKGMWRMDGVYNSAKVGPFAIILNPEPETETKGRGDFRIHGDSISKPGTASNGCIILSRAIRSDMWGSKDHILCVME